MNKCENCGFLHYRTDPCRVAKKSVSGRETDADSPLSRLPPKSASDDKSGRSQTKSTATRVEHIEPRRSANVSLPVDTNPSGADTKAPVITSSAGTDGDKDRQPKPRGRPRIHPDRKAYKAQHERDRRARKKESGNG